MAQKHELTSSEIDAKISEFEKRLKRLYRMYEQYFIGVENRPPHNERRQVVRLMRELEQLPITQTALKFRLRSMVQRFNSYKAYWNRTERQIEEGTYHRDVARARARKQRREERERVREEERETSGRAEDGAFELDELDLDELDLDSMERELQEMDQRGEFERYVATEKIKQEGFPEDQKPAAAAQPEQQQPRKRSQSSWGRAEVDENVKQQRLAELQAKLGLSTRGASGQEGGQEPQKPSRPQRRPIEQRSADQQNAQGGQSGGFDRASEGPTQKARPENPSAPSRGADMSKLRRLRKAKERLEKERAERGKPRRSRASKSGDSDKKSGERSSTRTTGSNRVIQRGSSSRRRSSSGSSKSRSDFSDEKSRKIYNSLIEAKRRCNEDTSGLNYNNFKKSMERQRTQIQRKKGARDVDFKVVIKEGRAFLKPETKK